MNLKRIISYYEATTENNERIGIVTSISDVVDVDSIKFNFDNTDADDLDEHSAFIEADIPKPVDIPGKVAVLAYDLSLNTLFIKYDDACEEEMTPSQRLEYLMKANQQLVGENEQLKKELELTQAALFELDTQLNGGAENE